MIINKSILSSLLNVIFVWQEYFCISLSTVRIFKKKNPPSDASTRNDCSFPFSFQ